MVLLEIRNLTKHFGGLSAIESVDFDVFNSEILGIIGPNGAGKTTLFNLINGFIKPTMGTIIANGEDITGLRADQIARKGIGRTFQAATLFMEATVFDNVIGGFHMRYKQSKWRQLLHTKEAKREEQDIRQKTIEILELMKLNTLSNELALNLPHGYQKALGICIALATSPKLLLLDEPMVGLNPNETTVMIDRIRQIRDSGVTIILVEHVMMAIMSLCDRIVVLNHGKKIAEGIPKQIRENKEVIEAYLGRKGDAV